MKRTLGALLFLGLATGLAAQPAAHKADYLNHMDLGINVTSTGIGLDVAMPVGDYVRLRTGFTYMPHFHINSSFPVEFSNQDNDADRLRRIQDMMYGLTGCRIDNSVDMVMQPTWGNFRFLVDVMPLPNNKHWHVTLGFYAGPSRIGKAFNVTEDAPTLISVGMFNNLYLKSYMDEALITYEDGNGRMHTADLPSDFRERFAEMGMVGMPLGKFSDGDEAVMLPDANSMARARMKVNKFRPYLGLGYSTAISKDRKLKLAVDAGVLLWGGSPHVYVDNVYKTNFARDGYDLVHWDPTALDADGMPGDFVHATPQTIDLTRDVSGIRGKVGDMVDVVKRFKCYPVLGITISRTLF